MPSESRREWTAPIRAALLGYGNSGQFYHLPLLRRDPRFDLRIIAARLESSLHGLDPGLQVERIVGWEHAIERDDIEVAVIALPHHLHFPAAKRALECGKHVLIEKPATVRTAEIDELLTLADRRGLVLMVHQQRRYEEDFQQLLGIVRSGELGRPWRINVVRSHQGPYTNHGIASPHSGVRPLEWAKSLSAGGGVGRIIGPHPIDHLLTLADSPIETVSGAVQRENGEGVEHWMGIDVRFRSGVLGHVEIFRRSGIAPPRFTVWGDEGMAVASNSTGIDVRLHSGETRVIKGLQRPMTLGTEIYDDLASAIRNGIAPRVAASAGRRVVEVIELAEKSATMNSLPLFSDESGHTTGTMPSAVKTYDEDARD